MEPFLKIGVGLVFKNILVSERVSVLSEGNLNSVNQLGSNFLSKLGFTL